MGAEFTDPDACVDALIAKVGRDLRVATPLAAGKPNHLLNALYRRAKADPGIRLTIFTALTLERPKGKSDLERRFLGPFVDRVFGTYPDLDYELDRVAERLPENVRVVEFYLAPGKFARNAQAQRDYVSSNYTHAARDVLDRDPNVLFQQVAPGEVDGEPKLSLSCNPDLTVDIMAALRRREGEGVAVAFVAMTNDELPFMFGDAVVDPDDFHFVVRNPELSYTVFGPPKMSVSDADFLIGLHVSALIKDGGELQVGIGSLADSVTHCLLMRHEKNDDWNAVVDAIGARKRFGSVIQRLGDRGPFKEGLFAASEMMVDGFLHLMQRGVIKRRVYDDMHLQRLINMGRVGEEVTGATLEGLLDVGAVRPTLTDADVEYLVRWGVFRPEVRWEDGELRAGAWRGPADLLGPGRAEIEANCLGERLLHGAVMHAAFFLGNQAFYRGLRELPEEQRRLIRMRSVLRVNQLYGHEDIDRLHRRHARFINTCMLVTASGAACSDGLADGTVVSGVGGQYNFVDMAQALPDGHSILNVRAARTKAGRTTSNIVWNYGHVTVPRHMRDIYVSEYGIAFVRGRTDEEIIQELLKITDSRFQDDLVAQAKRRGKLRADYQVPPEHRQNLPEAMADKLRPFKERGLFPAFPLGRELTDEELAIGRALKGLKAIQHDKGKMAGAVASAIARGKPKPETMPYLERMGLAHPKGGKEWLYQRLLAAQLEA